MENEYSYIDMSQFGHPEQLSNVSPSIIQQPQPVMVLVSEMPRLWQGLGMGLQQSIHPLLPPPTDVRAGKRQTSRQKYTDEEVQRICSMKEAGMPWSKIAAEFPGRSQKSLQVSYCVNFKKRAEKFQDDDKELLQNILREETAEMWKRVANRMGKSVKGCQQKAKEWGLNIR